MSTKEKANDFILDNRELWDEKKINWSVFTIEQHTVKDDMVESIIIDGMPELFL